MLTTWPSATKAAMVSDMRPGGFRCQPFWQGRYSAGFLAAGRAQLLGFFKLLPVLPVLLLLLLLLSLRLKLWHGLMLKHLFPLRCSEKRGSENTRMRP